VSARGSGSRRTPGGAARGAVPRADTPADLPRLLVEALNAGDAWAVVSLYETGAVQAPEANQLVVGREAIGASVAGFLAMKPRFRLLETEVVESGDLALVRSRVVFSVEGADPSGTQTAVAPSIVARRQRDGRWLVVIDRPLPGS
jgi:uncharacterized protein (TIGR02246 family)